MNRIARRAVVTVLLALVLIGGMGFFCYEYLTQAKDWVVFPGSPHVYNGGNIGTGNLTDRDGTVLLSMTDGRSYAESETLRKATLHWLGDREGRISAPAPSAYASQMVGFNLIQGLYSGQGTAGVTTMTLSAQVQKTALEAMGDRKGTIGVYNYQTGEILCAVSTPTYDPDNVPDIDNDTSGAYDGAFLNRFTQVSYVPGSIFKIVTTAAALEEIEDVEDMSFTCTGEYDIQGDQVTCERVHGTQSLKQALANSCNCAFAQVVELLGKDGLEKYIQQFQITEPVRFDGITTASGVFDLSKAARVEVAWSGIGQYLDQVNPCRYMTFMGAIAGGGKALQPYVISQVRSGNHLRYSAGGTSTGKLMSQTTAETLQEYLRNNVQTIYGADNFPGLTVCAKSGTAELGGDRSPNATFSGFVTDEAYPLAFVVVVENGGSGSAVCVPILSQVLSACKAVMDGA